MIEGFVESRQAKLHYMTNSAKSSGGVSLLFVPGVMMPAWIWEKQLDYFASKYRVVAMDLRSQGDSTQSTEGHYASSMAEDIKAVVDTLDLKPLVLVAWSLAVPIAVNYAALHGKEGLIGLVLVDGLSGFDSSQPFYHSTIDFWMKLQADRPAKTREFIRNIFKQPQPEEYFDKLYESAMRTPTNTAMTLIDNYLLQDFRPLLPKIDVPTLITTVEGPRLEYMKNLKTLLPDGRLEIVKDAAHTLFVDQPKLFNNILEEFIVGLDR